GFRDRGARPMQRGIRLTAWEQLFARHADPGHGLQIRLRKMIVGAITEGLLAPDAPLPSTRMLAQTLGISRNTVLLAYERLVDEEFIEARPRSGYFVRPQARMPRPPA